MPDHIFISYAEKDASFVRILRDKLEVLGLSVWVESRNLSGGDNVTSIIKEKIQSSTSVIVIVSANSVNSDAVFDQTEFALTIQEKRGDTFKIIPLLLDDQTETALRSFGLKGKKPVLMKSDAGGIDAALPALMAALGHRLPDDWRQPAAKSLEPVEELVLELRDPYIYDEGGLRRAAGTAELRFLPSQSDHREVVSTRYSFIAPLGPIEADDLRWYLEDFATWPAGVYQDRAETIAAKLPEWGKLLYNAALPDDCCNTVLTAWAKIDGKAERRFSVKVDVELPKGSPDDKRFEAREAATLLLSLPWEILRGPDGYLFLGAKPVRVRRRMPNRRPFDAPVSDPPVRILMVSPRPEDDHAGYFDHRISALPLVDALETLGDAAELTVLQPPTFPAMRTEIERAASAGKPYHVVHFDGHGIYRKDVGLGGLCFESPSDTQKLERRASAVVDAEKIAEVIRDHRIPLFFLDACQTAKAEIDPTSSVAAKLLENGIASVIAMSHSVLVETARRFTTSFYHTLVGGSRVGTAVLEGQKALQSEVFRGKVFAAGKLELEDWFVPVLYQEKDDPGLFKMIPSVQIRGIAAESLKKRFGSLPDPPSHRFIGRSRELLILERLLAADSYAVITGQGGEGKTTLAAEFARWGVRTGRFRRAVFVSLEDFNHPRAVMQAIGGQLVPGYLVDKEWDGTVFGKAFQPVARALEDGPAIIVFDNAESILPPEKFADSDTDLEDGPAIIVFDNAESILPPEKFADSDTDLEDVQSARFEPTILKDILGIAQKLIENPDARMMFTSREPMPAPFDGRRHLVRILRLERRDAVKLVMRIMTDAGLDPQEDDKGFVEPRIEELVEAVNCHARSLTLLAPEINRIGVERTTENIRNIMIEMEKKFLGSREQSLFASVELSLRRLSPGTREKIGILGVFHGGVYLKTLSDLLGHNDLNDVIRMGNELAGVGLAEMMPYQYLRLHPALCPYLYLRMDAEAREELIPRWAEGMHQLAGFLYEQIFEDARMASALTILDIPNLMAALEYFHRTASPEEIVNYATKLEQLLSNLGRPKLLATIVSIREAAAEKIGEWNNTAFNSAFRRIERMLQNGKLQNAYTEAQSLLEKAITAGENAYPGADYDIAMAHKVLGDVLKTSGAIQEALTVYDESEKRFQGMADKGDTAAARMAAASLSEKAQCFVLLGRLDEAAAAYTFAIEKDEVLGDHRGAASCKANLGTVRKNQKRYAEAIESYTEAIETFEELGEPLSVATGWHQIGMAYQNSGNFEAAETAYRKALAIRTQQGDITGEADTLGQLGNLHDRMERFEDAVAFYRQAAEKYSLIGDTAREGRARNNLAITLQKLGRYPDARTEIMQAIELRKPYSHAAEPWKSYDILCDIETAEGNPSAAAKARQTAIDLYLSYRKDGGENHEPGGRICHELTKRLSTGNLAAAKAYLSQMIDKYQNDEYGKNTFFPKLIALLEGDHDSAAVDERDATTAGERDTGERDAANSGDRNAATVGDPNPALTDDPNLDYDDAAEILLLLDILKA